MTCCLSHLPCHPLIARLPLQRLLGERSEWAPWIGALPKQFTTPPFYRGAEMDELMGTALHRATRCSKVLESQLQLCSQGAPRCGTRSHLSVVSQVCWPCRLLRENLERSWRQLQPTCELMCQQAGVSGKPTYHDFKWAYSIWWCALRQSCVSCLAPCSRRAERPAWCRQRLAPPAASCFWQQPGQPFSQQQWLWSDTLPASCSSRHAVHSAHTLSLQGRL